MGTGKLPKAMSCNTAKHHGQAFHPPGTPEGGWGGGEGKVFHIKTDYRH